MKNYSVMLWPNVAIGECCLEKMSNALIECPEVNLGLALSGDVPVAIRPNSDGLIKVHDQLSTMLTAGVQMRVAVFQQEIDNAVS